eukprot:gnl/Trimastix_PCT/3901.p1 GENE.gnl/Trimastix_PCT/3901~~gnl/Trimastix_PCT/3901.p1  ORF type:complete len:344 (+),score=70.49 gnl/Trimastix_PCT/3901:92-1123(+)
MDLLRADFSSMPRRELQALCKKYGIRANGKNMEMIAALTARKQKEEQLIVDDIPSPTPEEPTPTSDTAPTERKHKKAEQPIIDDIPSPAPVPEVPSKATCAPSTTTVSEPVACSPTLLMLCDDALVSILRCLKDKQVLSLRAVCRRFCTLIETHPTPKLQVILGLCRLSSLPDASEFVDNLVTRFKTYRSNSAHREALLRHCSSLDPDTQRVMKQLVSTLTVYSREDNYWERTDTAEQKTRFSFQSLDPANSHKVRFFFSVLCPHEDMNAEFTMDVPGYSCTLYEADDWDARRGSFSGSVGKLRAALQVPECVSDRALWDMCLRVAALDNLRTDLIDEALGLE